MSDQIKCTTEELAALKGPVAEALAKIEGYRRGVEHETKSAQAGIEALIEKSGYKGPFHFEGLGDFMFSKMPGRGSQEKGWVITPWTSPTPV